MRAGFVGISFLGLSMMASAAALPDFLGKYRIGRCDVLAWERGAPVYVRYDRSEADRIRGLQIYVYFKDGGGTGEYLLLGEESLQNPDYGRKNPVKTVVTRGFFRGEVLVNTVTHVYGSGRTKLVKQVELERTAKGLIYRESSEGQSSKCVLN